jgi:hypothetical protein
MTEREPGVLTALTDLDFERTATPAVAKLLYVVGLVLTALLYLAGVAAFFTRGFGLGVAAAVAGALAAVFVVLLLRVGLEYVVSVVRLAEDARRRR